MAHDNAVSVDDKPREAGKNDGAHALLLHMQLLGQRLYIQAWVRFAVVGGIIAGALIGKHVAGVENLDVRSLVILACLLGLFNIGALVAAYHHRDATRAAASYHFLQGIMHVTITVDYVFLTVALWLVGGAKSPFRAFYFLHVILASILLSPRSAYAYALFGYLLLSGLVLGQWWGIIPVRFPVGAVNSAHPLDGRFVLTVLMVQGLLMALTVSLVTGLVKLLRRGESRLWEVNAELERVSNMHHEFLHITLHDLKSPVSAATMLTHNLEATGDPPLNEEQKGWLKRIRERLNEVTVFLRDFEVLASLDSVDVRQHGKEVDVEALLQGVAAENQDMAQMRGHSLIVEIKKALPRVYGIERLLHEAVSNLLTNALKYTPENGAIVMRGRRIKNGVRIEVEDNGPGIAPEDQADLFKDLSRAHSRQAAPGKARRTGLGLSIVRRIAEEHGGRVGVESALKQGSTFFIELPTGPPFL